MSSLLNATGDHADHEALRTSQRLFRSVVAQAIHDAMMPVPEPGHELHTSQTLIRRKAREWLLGQRCRSDMIYVVNLAGMSPADVAERASQVAANDWQLPD